MRLFAAVAVALVLGLFQSQFALALPHHVGMHTSETANLEQSKQIKKSGDRDSELSLKVLGDTNCPSHSDEILDCCGYVCHSGAALLISFPHLPDIRPTLIVNSTQHFLASLPIYKLKRPPRP